MKKTALVSCYFKNNYGSLLQAYATQKILDDMGIENETINMYYCDDYYNYVYEDIAINTGIVKIFELVKYDKVKVLNGFRIKLLTIENVDKYFSTEDLILKQYLLLKSKQRYLKRINTRINKLNRYYNSLTELFARSIEIYFLNSSLMNLKAPKLKTIYDNVIAENMLPSLTKCLEFFT